MDFDLSKEMNRQTILKSAPLEFSGGFQYCLLLGIVISGLTGLLMGLLTKDGVKPVFPLILLFMAGLFCLFVGFSVGVRNYFRRGMSLMRYEFGESVFWCLRREGSKIPLTVMPDDNFDFSHLRYDSYEMLLDFPEELKIQIPRTPVEVTIELRLQDTVEAYERRLWAGDKPEDVKDELWEEPLKTAIMEIAGEFAVIVPGDCFDANDWRVQQIIEANVEKLNAAMLGYNRVASARLTDLSIKLQ